MYNGGTMKDYSDLNYPSYHDYQDYQLQNTTTENQEFLIDFIKMYQSFPCLWKFADKFYRCREIKDKAYNVLAIKLKEVDPSADKYTVIKKINSLRTGFRREYKKTINSRQDKNLKEPYQSTLWYYDILKFVVEDQEPDPLSTKNININIEDSETYHDRNLADDDKADTTMGYHNDDAYENNFEVKVEPNSPSVSRGPSPTNSEVHYHTRAIKRQRVSELNHELNHQARIVAGREEPRHEHVTPDYELFGSYVALKLRRSANKQSIIAEKLISEILMRSCLGNLHETTVISDA